MMENTVVMEFKSVNVKGLTMPAVAIYNSPADFQGKIVARLMDMDVPTNIISFARTEQEMREKIKRAFPHMINMGRGAEDHISLVEVWM